MIGLALAFEAAIALLAWVLAWLLGISLVERFHLDVVAGAWGVLLTVPLLVLAWLIMRFAWAPLVRLRREVEALVSTLFRDASSFQLAAVSLLAGAGEEALFRGVLQTAVAAWTSPLVGLAAASLVFGLAHLVTRTYAVLAGLIGLYLGALYLVFDNLLVPIGVHALYDFLALEYVRGREGREGTEGREGRGRAG